MNAEKILSSFPCWKEQNTIITAFCAEEDGREYSVWKVESPAKTAVLKKSSREEADTYRTFFSEGIAMPAIYAEAEAEGEVYLLMEYIEGKSLTHCTREGLVATLDALIYMQNKYWGNTEFASVNYGWAAGYASREKRLPYLKDLAACYKAYLQAFKTLPRTLCNDDMLPLNVLVNGERAVILDWEYAGILPYPCAMARLLAFGEEDPDKLFYMTRADRAFALDYYYQNLISQKGITRAEFERTMKLFFFKEYSEWVYCANKSGDVSNIDYKKYYALSRRLADELGY